MADSLEADVRQFASQLGLVSGSGGGDFSDFDPKKASKRVGKVKEQKPLQETADRKRGADGGPKNKANHANGQKTQHDRNQQNHTKGGGTRQRGDRPRTENGQVNGRGPQHGVVGSTNQANGTTETSSPAVRVRSMLPRGEPGLWFEAAATHTANLPAPGKKECTPEIVASRKEAAAGLLEREERAAQQLQGRRGGMDSQWLQRVKRSGTTADRVASASILVQDRALTSLSALDSLLDLAGKRVGARGVVAPTLDALTELFLTVLLPDRPLRFFEQQALDSIQEPFSKSDSLALLYLYFEDCIKKRYARYVEQLETGSRDPLGFIKDKCIKAMFDLLAEKPEQEQRLLTALVNKLGDPDRKLASKVGYLLTRLLAQHPAMKGVVIREMERFMFRPGLSDRARYYAVVYLNQMVLGHSNQMGGPELAKRLIDIYFTMFAMILEGKIGTAATITAAAAEKKKEGKKKKKKKDKGASAATLRNRTGELDARMLSALITGVRRAFPFVAAEDIDPLIARHADALFRLIHTRSFGVATQSLLLLFQLMSSRGAVSDRYYRALYAALTSPELVRSTKSTMFLSMLLKAVKADTNNTRAAAFTKRLLQVALEAPPAFACGCLILVSTFFKHRPSLWSAVLRPEAKTDDDGMERFRDADDDDDVLEPAVLIQQAAEQAQMEADLGLGWPSRDSAYDLHKRDPKFSNADASCLWELDCLAAHVHPSVSAMARSLLAGANIVFDGDPLRDLTVTAFLDKFTARKARGGAAKSRGGSAMQPLFLAPDLGTASLDFARLSEEEIAPEDLFFLRYYSLPAVQKKKESRQARRRRLAEQGEDDEPADEDASGEEDVDALLSGSESDEADEFLGQEEEGGEGGIGADPDRSLPYDYQQLAAAMAEDDEEEEEQGDEEDDFELEGASFSDMSEDEMSDNSDEEGDEQDNLLLDGELSDDVPSSSDDEDDEVADMEVRALLEAAAVKKGAVKEVEGGEDLNPFELPESSDEETGLSFEDEEQMEMGNKRKKRRASTGGMGDFAPAEAYEHLLLDN